MNYSGMIKLILAAFPHCEAIYLFGSFYSGEETSNSDIDIALLLPYGISQSSPDLGYSDLRFELEQNTGRKVDLVNLRAVNTVFQKEIIFNSKRIFENDLEKIEEFEMITLSLYQQLNDERKEILEQFKLTGRAYSV